MAMTAAVYWRIGQFGFVNFDDPLYVLENTKVAAGLSLDSLIWAFTASHASNWHPVTWLSHMLDCSLFGLDPGKHHLVSLFFHAANAVLLFFFLALTTRCFRRSVIAALIFALHPQHVEAVVWISERKELLSVFFMLLALLAYRRYTLTTSRRWYLGTLALFAAGLMSKPMLVSFPLLLLLVDYWPLARARLAGKASNLRQLLVEKIPFLLLASLSGAVTLWVQQQSGAVKSLQLVPLALRIKNAFSSYLYYCYKTIWPAELLLPYPLPAEIPLWQPLAAALLLTIVCLLAIRLAHQHPYLVFGWFWFLLALLPVIGLVQVGEQAMADRYSYLPHIGLLVCLVWGGGQLLARVGAGKTLGAAMLTVMLAGLAVRTHQQAGYWRSSLSLFQHAVAASSRNYTAHAYLALALAEQNSLAEAEKHYEQALALKPDYVEALVNLGVVRARRGNYEQGFRDLTQALARQPQDPRILNNLGNILKGQGQFAGAIGYYHQALALQADYPEALLNLAATLEKVDRFAESISQYQKILDLTPNSAAAHNGLGVALARSGRLNEALAAFQRALALQGDYQQARDNLQLAEGLLRRAVKAKGLGADAP